MRVIVMGCGRLGSELANLLSLEGHEVTVIDRDADAFTRLPKTFNGKTIVGHGFEHAVLKRAGIETADAFAAVTGGDNHNIVSARIAREEFRVPRVVARINDPLRAEIYRRIGVPTVATTRWATNKIRDLIVHAALNTQLTFGSGEVELVRLEVPHALVGKSVESVSIPGEIAVVSITRLGRAFVPTLGTVFEEGDVARLTVDRAALTRLEGLLGLK